MGLPFPKIGPLFGVGFISAFGLVYTLDNIFYIAKVDGVSMQPILNPDKKQDYVFIRRCEFPFCQVERGDIISLISPKKRNETLIKRVVGVSGDVIKTHGYKTEVVQIPRNSYWVEGDNYNHSMDSNHFGPIHETSILGKATHIVWPISRWQKLGAPEKSELPTNYFVKRLQWDLPGTVCRHGLTIGDVDNDGDNELVVGTAEGELYIFKGTELWQKIVGLGLVTSVAIGDIFNYGRNALVVICGDGWAHIFYSPKSVNPNTTASPATQQSNKEAIDQEKPNVSVGHANVDVSTGVNMTNSPSSDQPDGINEVNELSGKMECVHVQRIPTNSKIVLVADVDKDGANEMILGLTDRVVRSYRWSSNADLGTGKLVGLNKWECANQIGTVTLQHTGDGTPTLLVAQPGGTFMRIKCNPEDHQSDDESCDVNSEAAASCVDYQTLGISRMRSQNISTEIVGDLESGMTQFVPPFENRVPKYVPKDIIAKQSFADDTQTGLKNFKSASLEYRRNYSQPDMRKSSLDVDGIDQVDGNFIGGNVILGEYDVKVEKNSLLPSFKDFTHNNNRKIEIRKEESQDVGDTKGSENLSGGKPYALATLDGTIMLVKDEIILWAMQVDHQIFALCRLDVTGDGSDEIVACAWDGQTYILDQQRSSVRFQFEEPVRAFCTGKYSVTPGNSTPCLIYYTFSSKIFLYYDVILPSMLITPLNPFDALAENERKALDKVLSGCSEAERQQKLQQLTEWLLYGSH